MGFRFKNIAETKKAFDSIAKSADAEADRIAEKHTDIVFQETQRQVPKKTGALARTGRIEHSKQTGPVRSYSIWYGTSDTDNVPLDYAAAVHEIKKADHKTGNWKYVEGPMVESLSLFKQLAIRRIKAYIRRRFR